ncbi:MAG: DUF2799 domain-containing protein [Gammaproteobacteria bacterium]|nr:DUF2799 domain-containing protein [Gammaproteobacteria bacterium]
MKPIQPSLKFSFILCLFTMSGCATLSESQCKAQDWTTIGQYDAQSGYPALRMADHQNACDDYGITVDPAQYQTGYTVGLQNYCTAENGWSEGSKGNNYRGICPAESRFLSTYNPAKRLHDAQRKVTDLKQSLERLENQRDKLRRESRRLTLLIQQGKLPIEQLESLAKARNHTNQQLRDVHRERNATRRELDLAISALAAISVSTATILRH